MIKMTKGYRAFYIVNTVFLILIALVCILPLFNVFALSLSDNIAVQQGKVTFWPVSFTTVAYQYIMKNSAFWLSMWVSVKRVVLGFAVNMVLTIMVAYPLSKARKRLASLS